MSDAHSRMIHSFESILFKGFIKPVNRFANQFEWFVQFSAARPESSEAVHSDNIKSDEDVALDLQAIESKSAKACLLELYEDLLLDEHAVYCSTGIGHDTTMTLPVCCTCTLYIKYNV